MRKKNSILNLQVSLLAESVDFFTCTLGIKSVCVCVCMHAHTDIYIYTYKYLGLLHICGKISRIHLFLLLNKSIETSSFFKY